MSNKATHSNHGTAPRIILAGGGTGGHIFPAIAIANAIKELAPAAEILFVGAKGKMEMEKVPQAGYKIEGLDIAGFNRNSLIANLGLPLKLVLSFFQVRGIFRRFKPHAVIGVGGYSSFPVLRLAQSRGIPSFLHESNSYAGKSNKLLGQKATGIFVGTEGMESFFPGKELMVTGNPVRKNLVAATATRKEGIDQFGLDVDKKTLFVTGGSLGAKGINEAIEAGLDQLTEAGLQLIWQTGKPFAAQAIQSCRGRKNVWVGDFIQKMDLAYAAADLVVSRSGAMSVSEISVMKKPAVFVPYPLAAEDHQTANARKLVDKGAALLVRDAEAKQKLVDTILDLVKDEDKRKNMANAMADFAITDADTVIAKRILEILGYNK